VSLSGAAQAMGLPEALVQRSAEARAAETGQSVEDILAAWAGGEELPDAVPAEPSEPETEAPEEAEPEEREAAPEPAIPVIEEGEPAAAPAPGATPTRAPVPAEVTAAEAAHLPEVVTVPTAGIKERTNFVIPKWLTGLMLIVPLFALFALGGSSTGACGEATELNTDVITGEIVNCDGSAFTGGGAGGGGGDPIALGDDIYNGGAVAGVNCAGCHGAGGQGSGAFPALTGVQTTFGACTDHIEWVIGGSDSVGQGNPYGDTNKISQGGMPAFGGTLTDEQIAAVSAFERVRFGGQDQEEALVDCGLVEPADGEGEPSGDEGSDGEGGTGTTVPTEGEDEAEASSVHSG